jgi:hypothetical protein
VRCPLPAVGRLNNCPRPACLSSISKSWSTVFMIRCGIEGEKSKARILLCALGLRERGLQLYNTSIIASFFAVKQKTLHGIEF